MEAIVSWLISEPFSWFAGTGLAFVLCCIALIAGILIVFCKPLKKIFF